MDNAGVRSFSHEPVRASILTQAPPATPWPPGDRPCQSPRYTIVGVGVDRVECLQHPGMGQPVVAVEQHDDLLSIAGVKAAVEMLQGPHAPRGANHLDPMTDRLVREELFHEQPRLIGRAVIDRDRPKIVVLLGAYRLKMLLVPLPSVVAGEEDHQRFHARVPRGADSPTCHEPRQYSLDPLAQCGPHPQALAHGLRPERALEALASCRASVQAAIW